MLQKKPKRQRKQLRVFDTEKRVKDFIEKFEVGYDKGLWENLCKEEYKELLKEACDFIYVLRGFGLCLSKEEKEEYDEGINLVQEKLTSFFSDGEFTEAFKRVHNSNMSKLGEDGKPIKREDGKILKGPKYKEPNFNDLVGM